MNANMTKAEFFDQKAAVFKEDGFVLFDDNDAYKFDNDEAWEELDRRLPYPLVFVVIQQIQNGQIMLLDTSHKRKRFIHKGRLAAEQQEK